MHTRTFRIGALILVAAGLLSRVDAQEPVAPAAAEREVIEAAPTDRAVAIPKTKLASYFQSMDAKKQQTLRLLEGGKYSVNIRRITIPEPARFHPSTMDLWVALDGPGMVTTGGRIDNGTIVGGTSHPIKPGDVEFVPAAIPHGMSPVDGGTITWMNIHWDSDWPAAAELGAGELPGRPGSGGGPARPPVDFAPTDRSVAIPREKMDGYRREMATKNLGTLRMIEGGHFNVNLRRITEPSIELHKVTIDTWVLLEGSGTVNTGFEMRDGKRVPGTGRTFRAAAGDVFFIPANLSHGFSAVDGAVSWLNIRWDQNYGK